MEEQFIILPESTITLLLQQNDPSELIALYCVIYYHLKFIAKEKALYFEEEICKLLKWDINKLQLYEKKLIDLNIINLFTFDNKQE